MLIFLWRWWTAFGGTLINFLNFFYLAFLHFAIIWLIILKIDMFTIQAFNWVTHIKKLILDNYKQISYSYKNHKHLMLSNNLCGIRKKRRNKDFVSYLKGNKCLNNFVLVKIWDCALRCSYCFYFYFQITWISEILVADPVRNIKDGPLSKSTMESTFKDAVSKFGGRIDWKSRRTQSLVEEVWYILFELYLCFTFSLCFWVCMYSIICKYLV